MPGIGVLGSNQTQHAVVVGRFFLVPPLSNVLGSDTFIRKKIDVSNFDINIYRFGSEYSIDILSPGTSYLNLRYKLLQ